jgi:hypothetical protein
MDPTHPSKVIYTIMAFFLLTIIPVTCITDEKKSPWYFIKVALGTLSLVPMDQILRY